MMNNITNETDPNANISYQEYANIMVAQKIDASAFSNCTDTSNLSLTPGMNYYTQAFAVPVLFVLGLIGNTLNLTVLLSKGMRSQANTLLAGMAMADITLLTIMMFSALGAHQTFVMSDTYRVIMYATQTLLVTASNVLSTITIWLMLAVSVERYMGIRSPMHTRKPGSEMTVVWVMIAICIFAVLINIYHYYEHYTGYIKICNGSITFGSVFPIDQIPNSTLLLRHYVYFSKIIQITIVIMLPLVLIVYLNLQIIFTLRRSNLVLTRQTIQTEEITTDQETRQKRERKVTATVLAIITCFILTQPPSILPFVFELFHWRPKWMLNYINPLLGVWLLFGKVMNFVLFCMSSAYFRRRLNQILRQRCRNPRQKKYSGVSSGQSVKGQAIRMSAVNYHRGVVARQSSCITHLD